MEKEKGIERKIVEKGGKGKKREEWRGREWKRE